MFRNRKEVVTCNVDCKQNRTYLSRLYTVTCMICFLNIMILVYLGLKLFVPLISIAATSDVSLLAFKIAIIKFQFN